MSYRLGFAHPVFSCSATPALYKSVILLFLGQEIKRVIKKKRKDIPAEEKKICLWVLDDGTACGKTFTKFDSLKRHVSEAHKGVRPFSCTLCGKNYGRRDYLLRHLRSHNEAEVASISTTRIVGQNNQVVSLIFRVLNLLST